MTTTTVRRLDARELPLVLLASVAHPNGTFRRDIARRLDAAIDAAAPQHSVSAVRRVIRRQARTRRSGVKLNPLMRELTIRVARLAFTRNRAASRERLHIAQGTRNDGMDGYLLTSDLEVIHLARCTLTRHREKRQQQSDCKFIVGKARNRLRQFSGREPVVRAACRIESRFLLEMTGELPFDGPIMELCAEPGGISLAPTPAGFAQQRDSEKLRLWTATPEAILRFSAWLAEGRTLILASDTRRNAGRVLLHLRDFEGDSAELPALTTSVRSDNWLVNIPAPAMELTDQDRLNLVRWGVPPDEWVTSDIVETLF